MCVDVYENCHVWLWEDVGCEGGMWLVIVENLYGIWQQQLEKFTQQKKSNWKAGKGGGVPFRCPPGPLPLVPGTAVGSGRWGPGWAALPEARLVIGISQEIKNIKNKKSPKICFVGWHFLILLCLS